MNDSLYSTKYVATELRMSTSGLKIRATSAGVKPIFLNNKIYFNFEQIEQIKNHKSLKKTAYIHKKSDEVIAYFKTNKDNRTSVIAEHFNIGKHQVSNIIDTYYASLKPKE